MSERSSSLARHAAACLCEELASVRSAVMPVAVIGEEPRTANNACCFRRWLAGEVRASDIMAVSGHE